MHLAHQPREIRHVIPRVERYRAFIDETRHKERKVLGSMHPIAQGKHLLSEIRNKIGDTEPEQTGMDSADRLLEAGRRVENEFALMLNNIAFATDGELKIANLKSRARIEEKVQHEYDGNFNAIRDVVRATVIFDTLEDLYKGVNMVHGLAKIRFVADRFDKPMSSGYRDLKFNLEIQGQDGEKHIVELQFHLRSMLEAKRQESSEYNHRRKLQGHLKQLKSRNGDPKEIEKLEIEIAYSQNRSQKIYQRAWEPFENEFLLAA